MRITSGCLRLRGEVGESTGRNVTVEFIPRSLTRDSGYRIETFKSASGLDGLVGPACPTRVLCLGPGRRLVVPSENLVITVTATQGNRAPVQSIVETVMLLPDGYTTVPPIIKGMDTEDAVDVLTKAGFQADAPTPSPAYYFWDTTPAAGAVVAEGSTVAVHVGDG